MTCIDNYEYQGLIVKNGSRALFLLAVIFFVNFLSLVFQVVWTRELTLIFGTSALSVSTVLTVFMAGIALGGFAGGKLVTRFSNKERTSGYILVVLGLYCIAVYFLMDFIHYPFQRLVGASASPFASNFYKFLLSALLLIFPTSVIGAAFPVITHLYSDELSSLGKDVASIYFLDTLGAAIGAGLAGFLLVPVAGVFTTTMSAGLAFVALGLLLLWRSGGSVAAAVAAGVAGSGPKGARPGLDNKQILVLLALFVSGFSALVLEVAWSRYFHLVFGTSTYAFALVISAFLTGLSAGSFVVGRLMSRIRSPYLVFAFIEIFIAGTSLAVMQTSDSLEHLYMYLFYSTGSFFVFQGLLYVTAFLLLLIPVSLMGANFPLAVKLFAREGREAGADAGLVFSINTAGGIFGAFAAGFFIVPALGLEGTGMVAALIYGAVGLAFLVLINKKPLYTAVAVAICVVFTVLAYRSSDEPNLDISVYYNGIRKGTYEQYVQIKKNANIVYSKHGIYGLVAVEKDDVLGNVALWTNGKVDASTSAGDLQNQEFLGHLPLFFHPSPKKVLNIGLGSGVTVGSLVSHSYLDVIDCAEIDPLVVEAASLFFKDFNEDALSDPRVAIKLDDGRYYLDTAEERYDVIISEPSNIWITGVSQLFTKEFYEIADEHLEKDGIFTQWLPLYDLTDKDIKLVLKTLGSRFSHVVYWTNKVDMIILASREPFRVDDERIRSLMADERIRANISKVVADASPDSIEALLDGMVATEAFLKDSTKDFTRLNTDDRNYLEFDTVRNSYAAAHRVAKKREAK